MEYWRKRQLQILTLAYEEALKELRSIYKDATDRIQKELTKLYLEICDDQDTPIVSKLYQYNRYYRLIRELQKIVTDLGLKEEKILTNSMQNLYITNFNKLGEKLPPAPLIDTDTIKRLINEDWVGDGNNFSDRLWKNKALMANNAKKYIMLSIAEGKHPYKFVKDLEPYLKKNSLQIAKRLLITEMAHTQYISTLERYKAASIDKVQILTANDDKVCQECIDRSNKEYDIDNCPVLPTHCFCRCTLIPVI
jgi:SPP1 gp7 family putative phage head morphogenesis protein